MIVPFENTRQWFGVQAVNFCLSALPDKTE